MRNFRESMVGLSARTLIYIALSVLFSASACFSSGQSDVGVASVDSTKISDATADEKQSGS